MVKPIILVLAAIPAIVALLIAVPMITKTEIPFSAANPRDSIQVDYSKHHLITTSFGITNSITSQKSQIIRIQNNGDAVYTIVDKDRPSTPEQKFQIDQQTMHKLAAFIKETGIVSIPDISFKIKDNATQYQKFILQVTLNGQSKQISWPSQNATDDFVPPLLTQIGLELDGILEKYGK